MAKKYSVDKPMLCMIVGVAGSGKTLLANQMAKQLHNSAFLSKDLIQNCFTNTERGGGKTYSLIRGPTFNLLVNFADMQLSHGKTPIIEGPFSWNFRKKDEYADWVSHFRNVAKKHDARLAIVRCLPPSTEELRKRIKARVDAGTHPWDQELKLDDWEAWLKFEPVDFPIPHDDVHEIVSDRPTAIMAEDVLEKYLGAKKA